MNATQLLQKGSIVKYKHDQGEGHYRITAVFKKTCNIGGIFNGKIYHRGVPLEQVTEDREAWYDEWSKSETYQCM